MAPRPPTLIDVARRAGVGKTTASDALSGTGRVSADTRAIVLAAADELGYVPNRAARQLRRGATGVIAVTLPETLSTSHYYMSFVFGIVQEAGRHDYDVTIVNPVDSRGVVRPVRADGVIISDPSSSDPFVHRMIESTLPLVTSERIPGASEQPSGVVWSAHEAAMRELLDVVEGSGARRPALLVADDTVTWAKTLAETYEAWCRERGVEPVISTVAYDATWAAMQKAVGGLLDLAPEIDALICGPDGSAVEVLPSVHARGRTVGTDFVIASCVDSLPMQTAVPPITAIDLAPRAAGMACARLLIDIIAGAAPSGTEVEHAIRVVERASTRPLP